MILTELKRDGEIINRNYFNVKTTWSIAALKRGPIREEYIIFKDLLREVKKLTRPTR